MNTNVTRIICLLDRSGSMQGLLSDTLGGYNTFIDKQRAEPGDAIVTLAIFDDKYEEIYVDRPLSQVPLLTEEVYFPRGGTALLDAMGRAISPTQAGRTIVVIFTDGEENRSTEFRSDAIAKLVERRQKEGWNFVFFGAGMDAIGAAKNVGIGASHVGNVMRSATGAGAMYAAASASVASYRGGRSSAVQPDLLAAQPDAQPGVQATWVGIDPTAGVVMTTSNTSLLPK